MFLWLKGISFGPAVVPEVCRIKAVAAVSDAVVIGSRIIQELENSPRDKAVDAVRTFLSGIRKALDE